MILSRYPDAVPRNSTTASTSSSTARASEKGTSDYVPLIANVPIKVHVEVRPKRELAHGVALAQGGRVNGYALHFIEGRPAFDVRVDEKVTRILGPEALDGIVTTYRRRAITKPPIRFP